MKKCLIGFLVFFGLVATGSARAETHALIMTISDYQSGIPKLKGVVRDVESARSIARLMGVKDENMQWLHDEQLTLEGMKQAFDELDSRVVSGDKVFIYYSGHGGRQIVHDPEERCAESLVTVNGYGFTDAEMETRLKKLSDRTQKIITLFDSCHSGGVVTRAIQDTQDARFVPKFWTKGGSESCEKPVNVLTRGIKLASGLAGSGAKNYIYIAAANDNEISLDQPGKGGVATQAWLECMSGKAEDSDRSGGLTVEEIQVCAQEKINAQMKDVQGFLPQHINVIGNPQLVMTLVGKNPDVPQEPAAQIDNAQAIVPPVVQPVTQPVAQPVTQPIAQPVQPVQREAEAPATLLDIYNGKDDHRTVEITPAKNKLKIGSDKFSFSLRSSHAGYLYLLMVGSDGKTFDLLFPNKLDGDNYIQAGQTVRFPRTSWEVIAQGPAGKDHILAIVADAPRDLTKLSITNAGPFSVVSATQGGKRGIQLVTSTPTAAVQNECGSTGKRNLAVAQVCSDAYGAAMAAVEEQE